MRSQSGFSLIELLIVVAIILIIAAIAIPNLMRAKISANEASAVNTLRTLTTAETTYNSTYPTVGYACDLQKLGPGSNPPDQVHAGLIDSIVAAGTKAGYVFAPGTCKTVGPLTVTFQYSATPLALNTTGTRYFCTDTPGLVKYDLASVAACFAGIQSIQ